MTFSRRFLLVAALLLVAAVCAAYAPHAGRGFKQDDFAWIASSRVRQAGDWPALFARNTGFYRPVVALSFALDELAFGMRPRGYGLTNLALLLACLLAVVALARAAGLAAGAALAAAAIWALNFQGINMAVVWTSGRTALLLVLFSALAARAFARGRGVQAALFTLLALLSKEEAVMLPAVLFAWAAVGGNSEGRSQNSEVRSQNSEARSQKSEVRIQKSEGYPDGKGEWGRENGEGRTHWFAPRAALEASWPLVVPLVVYAVLRHASGAFGPLSAPAYYRLGFAPARVADNVVKYADFAATWPAAVAVLAAALARVVPRPSKFEARVIAFGVIWLIGGYAVTVLLPIRSPLYACFPAVGAALAAGALLAAVWSRASAPARSRLVGAGLLLPFLLLPVYWARNARHARGAQLSAQLLEDLAAARTGIPGDAVVVLLDDPRLPPPERLPAAFGTLYEIAIRDTLGRPTRSWIEPPPEGWELAGLRRPDPAAKRVVFAFRDGHLVRISQ